MTVSMNKVIKIGYTIYNPFLGLLSWKQKIPVSALYHSLSVATIAGDIASLFRDYSDEDEIDIATYGGLIHDLYQKGKDVKLTKEKSREIVKKVLEEEGFSERVIDDILESATYNMAENPSVWRSKHPVASLSMQLADAIASRPNAFDIYRLLIKWKGLMNKFTEVQQKLLDELEIDVISLTMPQIALRSSMYRLIINEIWKRENFVPIIAKGGLVIVRRSESPININIDDILRQVKNDEEIDRAIEEICKAKTCRERLEDLKRLRLEDLTYMLENLILAVGINITFRRSLEGSPETKNVCLFCGLSTRKVAIHPGVVGYLLYRKAVAERWNPRLPAISYEGSHLNYLMQRSWKRRGVVICPLCALDAFEKWRGTLFKKKIENADYIIHFYFNLPTHYKLAWSLTHVVYEVLKENAKFNGISMSDVVEKWDQLVKIIKSTFDETPEITDLSETRILDASWLTCLDILQSQYNGENKDLAYYLSLMAKAILFTGLYPVKFTRKPDPLVERRIIMPVYPLYDYDIADENLMRNTPLMVILLSLINELDSEIARLRGEKLDDEDIIRATLNYLKYPFEFYKDLLARHKDGRKVLEAYKKFMEDPLTIYERK